MLEITNLKKGYGKKNVIKDLSYSFGKKTYGLLGPNGAGKTTLMRCIVGLYNIPKETIKWNGVATLNNKEFIQTLSYLPQKFGVYKELSVREMLTYFGDAKKVAHDSLPSKITEVLNSVNLSSKEDDKVKSLSGGMIRRLGIAQTLINDPEIIILDEPTTGLDPEERKRFKDLMISLNGTKTIILSTHIVEDVEKVCDEIVIMNEGRFIFSGSSAELCIDNKTLEEGFLCKLREDY